MIIPYRLMMLSDWHIGTGAGRSGEVNATIRRDHRDLPFVPAKSLTGILRDACETAARALDDGQDRGSWQRIVTVLFGSQPGAATKVAASVAAAAAPPTPAALRPRR